MKFAAHLSGGLITGAVVLFLGWSYSPELAGELWLVWPLAVVASLLPDLDIKSIAQLWFYRVIFALLLILGALEQFRAASLLALLAMTPLLSKHRGWTHRIWAALLVPPALLLVYAFEYQAQGWGQQQVFGLYGFGKQQVLWLWYWLAMTAGWLCHLILDALPKLNK